MDKEQKNAIAHEIWRQLYNLAGFSAVCSWGLHDLKFTEIGGRAALTFLVQGLLHTGQVAITYDEGLDLYDITLTDNTGKVKATAEGVYFDGLAPWLDEHIERAPGLSDEEYSALVNQERNRREYL